MNNDLISREALKEQAETVTLWNGDVRRFVSYETIDNAPTVLHDNYSMGYQDGVKKVLSEERPAGHWIITNRKYELKDKDNTFVGMYHKCSECGFDEARGGKFCLNCGADMRKEAEHDSN